MERLGGTFGYITPTNQDTVVKAPRRDRDATFTRHAIASIGNEKAAYRQLIEAEVKEGIPRVNPAT